MSLSLDFDFIHVCIQSHYGLKKELKLDQIIAARMTAHNHLIWLKYHNNLHKNHAKHSALLR